MCNLFDISESPRVLMRNGKVDEARDVVDMLSLEDDPATRAAEVVRIPHEVIRSFAKQRR